MPLTTSLRSSLRAVLAKVRTQIAAVTSINAARIFIVGRDLRQVPHLQGDQDIVLKLGGFTKGPGHRDRHDCRVKRRLYVIVRTRFELDETDRDDLYFTDSEKGQIVFEEDVIDALQNYHPEDGQGNTLLFEPIDCVQGDDPVKAQGQDREWGEVKLTFHLPIRLPLDQTWQ